MASPTNVGVALKRNSAVKLKAVSTKVGLPKKERKKKERIEDGHSAVTIGCFLPQDPMHTLTAITFHVSTVTPVN